MTSCASRSNPMTRAGKVLTCVIRDASNWLTGWLITEQGLWGYVRNGVNLVLVDQADGFLLGMAFMALVSVLLWPFRACGRWCLHRLASDRA